jgi:hypothetical protein
VGKSRPGLRYHPGVAQWVKGWHGVKGVAVPAVQ